MSGIEIIYSKLREFIRAFYMQQIAYGFLLLFLVFGIIYLVSNGLEYNFYFSKIARAFIFWITILVLISILIFKISIPIYKYLSYSSRIKPIDAAKIIGNHFPQIQDKLINLLQLAELKYTDNNELIIASIDQKIEKLKWVKFTKAIDWNSNKKLLKYLSIPASLLLLIWIFYPAILSESTHRIIRYDQTFKPKAPFEFRLLNPNPTAIEQESIEIEAKFEGKSIPNEMNIWYLERKIKMIRTPKGTFIGTLDYLEAGAKFSLESIGYRSDDFSINVIPKPILTNLQLQIVPPAYTGLKPFSQKDIGDISAPFGSLVLWDLETKSIDQVIFVINQNAYSALKNENKFGFKFGFRNSSEYKILTKNNKINQTDTLSYSVNWTPDLNPTIDVKEFLDSSKSLKYYAGEISDDYGFSSLKLVFNHQFEGKFYTTSFNLPIQKGKNQLFEIKLKPYLDKFPKGSKLEYYFEVADNDAILGPKKTKTQQYTQIKLSEQQEDKANDAKANSLKSELSQSIKDAKLLQKKAEELRKKMLEKKSIDWNDKQLLQDLLNKQKLLQENIKETQQEIKDLFDKKSELSSPDPETIEKQKQLEELMQQVKNPELEKMLEQMKDMMENADKKNLMQELEKMDNKSDKLQKELDRMLNLYKNLDYEQKFNSTLDKMEKLVEKLERISKETALKEKTAPKELEALNQNKEIKEDLKKLNELFKDIKQKENTDLNNAEKLMEEAQKLQEEAKEDTEQKNEQKSEKQKNAAKKVKEAKDMMKKSEKKRKNNERKEDAATMRRLLQNLIYLSFEQENIIESTKKTNIQSPNFPKTAQKQRKIKDDFKMVEDSLYNLATRQNKIKKTIFEEIEKINTFTDKSIFQLAERKSNLAIVQQQFALTGYNNLALMISESLRKMNEENDSDDDSESNSSCDNPKKGKKGKPSAEKLSELQKQLNEQLEKLKEEMENKGKEPKDKNGNPQMPNKKGEPGTQGENGTMPIGDKGLSEQLAKIAAQQAAIRNALKQLEENKNQPDKSGNKPLGNNLGETIKKMEQTEKDLFNKKVYHEMMRRQKEIEVKLLEAAKAEREQDEEKKRESEQAKPITSPTPPELKKYLEQKKNGTNANNKIPIGLTPYYQKLVNQYLDLIK